VIWTYPNDNTKLLVLILKDVHVPSFNPDRSGDRYVFDDKYPQTEDWVTGSGRVDDYRGVNDVKRGWSSGYLEPNKTY